MSYSTKFFLVLWYMYIVVCCCLYRLSLLISKFWQHLILDNEFIVTAKPVVMEVFQGNKFFNLQFYKKSRLKGTALQRWFGFSWSGRLDLSPKKWRTWFLYFYSGLYSMCVYPFVLSKAQSIFWESPFKRKNKVSFSFRRASDCNSSGSWRLVTVLYIFKNRFDSLLFSAPFAP